MGDENNIFYQKRALLYLTLLNSEILTKKQIQYVKKQVLDAALAIPWEYTRAEVLIALAPHLPQDVLNASLEFSEEFYDLDVESNRARVLSAVADYLPQKVLEVAITIPSEFERARILSAVAHHLPQQTLDAALIISAESARAEVLIVLAPHLPSQVLDAALAISWKSTRAEVLIALAPHLPQDVLNASLEMYRFYVESTSGNVLCVVAPYLPQQVLDAALTFSLCARIDETTSSPSLRYNIRAENRNLQHGSSTQSRSPAQAHAPHLHGRLQAAYRHRVGCLSARRTRRIVTA